MWPSNQTCPSMENWTMTAWFSFVIPMFITTKCCIDFIVLEYGSKFRLITDDTLVTALIVVSVYTLLVDSINFFRGRQRTL